MDGSMMEGAAVGYISASRPFAKVESRFNRVRPVHS